MQIKEINLLYLFKEAYEYIVYFLLFLSNIYSVIKQACTVCILQKCILYICYILCTF